jgi:hypothetical protein
MNSNKQQTMKNNKQQTAVEWFHQKTWDLKIQLESGEISVGEYATTYATLYEQAKETEKEHIMNAYMIGALLENISIEAAEQYYDKTYGGGNK